MKRKAGVAHIKGRDKVGSGLKRVGEVVQSRKIGGLHDQRELLQMRLQEVVRNNCGRIQHNPCIKHKINLLARALDIDLVDARESPVMSTVGENAYCNSRTVRVLQICTQEERENGGSHQGMLIPVRLIIDKLNKSRPNDCNTLESISQTLALLAPLGYNYSILDLGMPWGKYINTKPSIISSDLTLLLQLVSELYANSNTVDSYDINSVAGLLSWSHARAHLILNHMVQVGLAWIEQYSDNGTKYWFIGLLLMEP